MAEIAEIARSTVVGAHVFTLTIDHRHGTDVYVNATEEGRLGALYGYACAWWADARRGDDTLPAAPPEDADDAIDLYFDALGGEESYSLDEVVVQA